MLPHFCLNSKVEGSNSICGSSKFIFKKTIKEGPAIIKEKQKQKQKMQRSTVKNVNYEGPQVSNLLSLIITNIYIYTALINTISIGVSHVLLWACACGQ